MKLIQHNKHIIKRLTLHTVGFIILLILNTSVVMSQKVPQPDPPLPLCFGNFINNVSTGGTGTITMPADGSNKVKGDGGIIVLYSALQQPAEIIAKYKKQYPSVTVTFDTNMFLSATINSINYKMKFAPSVLSPNNNNTFIFNTNSGADIPIYIGGILTVGDPTINPGGNYSGIFNIYLRYNNN